LEAGRKLNGHFSRLCLAIAFFLALMHGAQAETVAQTVRKWGLLGPWSLDCSLKPDRNKGTVLAYEIASGDRVVHRRDFGDMTDESEVVTAEISADGILNLRVFFPSLRQTREYGFRMQPDGTIRAMYNRNQKNEYTIKDGKFIANGDPTPPQHKCNRESSGSSVRVVLVLLSEKTLNSRAMLLNTHSEFSWGSPGTFLRMRSLILAQPRRTA
jgi:hypothetical protein